MFKLIVGKLFDVSLLYVLYPFLANIIFQFGFKGDLKTLSSIVQAANATNNQDTITQILTSVDYRVYILSSLIAVSIVFLLSVLIPWFLFNTFLGDRLLNLKKLNGNKLLVLLQQPAFYIYVSVIIPYLFILTKNINLSNISNILSTTFLIMSVFSLIVVTKQEQKQGINNA